MNPNIAEGMKILFVYAPYSLHVENNVSFGPEVNIGKMTEEDIDKLYELGWDAYDLPNGNYRWRYIPDDKDMGNKQEKVWLLNRKMLYH